MIFYRNDRMKLKLPIFHWARYNPFNPKNDYHSISISFWNHLIELCKTKKKHQLWFIRDFLFYLLTGVNKSHTGYIKYISHLIWIWNHRYSIISLYYWVIWPIRYNKQGNKSIKVKWCVYFLYHINNLCMMRFVWIGKMG